MKHVLKMKLNSIYKYVAFFLQYRKNEKSVTQSYKNSIIWERDNLTRKERTSYGICST